MKIVIEVGYLNCVIDAVDSKTLDILSRAECVDHSYNDDTYVRNTDRKVKISIIRDEQVRDPAPKQEELP